ncbi:cation-translocating P-type ATPase [symbiont of Argiope bruennichi]|uniref:HAD-IC family P-type ATPase n=1 Tax=symbiont of Argiope bruennichi TaxID=2810479 RepID=UPI003DA23FEB
MVRVAKNYQDFALTYLINTIKNYKKTPQKYQKISEVVANYLTFAVLSIAFLTFLIHLIIGLLNSPLNFKDCIFPTISVLVIFCPCALGITIPLLLAITSMKANRKKIIINNPNLIDKISSIDTVVFDKTGTLTKNEIYFENLTCLDNNSLYFSILRSLEQKSQHPIAQSILNMLVNYPLVNITNFKEIFGVGVFGKYSDKEVAVISKEKATKRFSNLKIGNFNQEIFLIYDNRVVAGFDKKILFRKEAINCLHLLKKLKYNTYIITGDNNLYDEDIEKIVDRDNIFTKCLPEKKLSIVKSLRNQRNLNLIYVGDGINDILSLKEANISVGIGSRFDLASIQTDIVLVNNNLMNIIYVIFLLKRTKKFIIFSLTWSIVYNLIFALVASFGLIPPVFSGMIMIFSDIFLLIFALFLYFYRLKI